MAASIRLAAVALIASCCVCAARAADFTMADLMAACQSSPGSPGDRACSIFIGGFAAGLAEQRLLQIQGHAICLPVTDALAASRQAIQAFADAHPELRDAGAAQVATEALWRAFPCPH
jgi:hypothetical protein